MINYRNGFDRQIGMYFAFLVVTVVGAAAALAILSSIEATGFESDAKYQHLIDDPREAEIPDTR